jgi:hypothetical protein
VGCVGAGGRGAAPGWPRRAAPARLAGTGSTGPDPTAPAAPTVFTLVPLDDRLRDWLDARAGFLDALQRRAPGERGRRGLGEEPAPALPPASALLVFRRRADGRVTVDDFPDEADVCEPLVGRLDPDVVRLERGRLHVTVANGAAVYVPVGPSPWPGCTRYGRLYRRPPGG